MILAVMVSTMAFSQKKNFTGVIIDSAGEPVIGATVKVKGTTLGTVSDFDGRFQVSAPEGSTLVISYVGCETKEVKAAADMKITLADDAKALDEVVVIGYGVQKKSVVTASIAKVSADDREGKAHLRSEDALKGLAAGVTVTSSSGQPGAKSMIRIRGIGTINDSNPLYIIDGLATHQNGMELVNP